MSTLTANIRNLRLAASHALTDPEIQEFEAWLATEAGHPEADEPDADA